MDKAGVGTMQTSDTRRIAELERRVDEERRKRLAAERQLGGLRSAVARMHAMLLKQKAEEAEQKAERVGEASLL
jgi:hypothetical protein